MLASRTARSMSEISWVVSALIDSDAKTEGRVAGTLEPLMATNRESRQKLPPYRAATPKAAPSCQSDHASSEPQRRSRQPLRHRRECGRHLTKPIRHTLAVGQTQWGQPTFGLAGLSRRKRQPRRGIRTVFAPRPITSRKMAWSTMASNARSSERPPETSPSFKTSTVRSGAKVAPCSTDCR